jgi:hypothetical protein
MKKSICMGIVIGVVCVTQMHGGSVTINFDSLTGSASGDALQGQDGWSNNGSSGDVNVYTAADAGIAPNNVSGNFIQGEVSGLRVAQKDISFGFNDTDPITVQFDLAYREITDQRVALADGAEFAPRFGMDTRAFVMRAADAGTTTSEGWTDTAAITGLNTWSTDDLIRIVWTLDPTANSGDGAMSMQMTNLTLDNGAWLDPFETAAPSGVAAGLLNMDGVGASLPSNWDRLYVEIGYTDSHIDNIVISQGGGEPQGTVITIR